MPKTYFAYTGAAQTFTVLATGTYDITAFGAQGGGYGGNAGGMGAEIGGEFTLTAGEVLTIDVGGVGSLGGGGGGSFVVETSDGTNTLASPLVIAGGGGGAGSGAVGGAGLTSTGAGGGSSGGGGGGNNGYGGGYGAGLSGGGGGFKGDGGSSSGYGHGYHYGGGGFPGVSGGVPGKTGGGYMYAPGKGFYYAPPNHQNGAGGFGGGGAGGWSSAENGFGGGGGGYSGGGGGGPYGYGGQGGSGGGGGSFDGGANQVLAMGENSGAGSVTITAESICYLRGTRILTPTGEVPVESLKLGDRVVTRFAGIRAIKWVGRQSFDARPAEGDRWRMPVCIRAGALDDGLPARDLYVSPGHSLLVGENLILAKSLINGVSITQDWAPADIHYYNIELETHDCVVAEGTWAETFADGPGLRDKFHNLAEFEALYPDYCPPEELVLCAPRPERGAKLDAALRPVAARTALWTRPGELRGFVDKVTLPWRIEGWAQDAAHPDVPVLLEVLLEDRVVGTVLACDHRPDLEKAGLGRGCGAFAYRVPVRLRPGSAGSLRVRRAGDGAELPLSRDCQESLGLADLASAAPRLRLVA